MAQLEQLMVRGIRSVGTEEQDAQVIRFLNPLTIISGPNGTGKTTIIEALNFATSSSLPPGKMGTFLHSLQVSRKPRVDAMVKLQFFDTKRRNCVMTKRMTSTINPKTSKPKTSSEEGTIQITSKDGSVRSLSSKVCDLKKEMINLLAVPSAILDNVIFCHQEESCWPLSEPKELKTRFDRIFQLTKFVKALDQMKKTKKEYENELKVIAERKINAERNVQDKARYVSDKESTEQTRAEAKQRLKDLKDEIAENSLVIREGQEKLAQMERKQRQMEMKQTELRVLRDQMKNLKVQPYVGSDKELKREIEELSSSSEFVNMSREKEKIERRMQELASEIDTLSMEKKRLDNDKVRLMSAEMHRKDLARELSDLERELAEDYRLCIDFEIDDQLNTVLQEQKKKLGTLKLEADAERLSSQQRLEAAQSELTRLQCEQTAAAKAVRQLDGDIAGIEQRLSRAAGSQKELSDLSARISSVESRLAVLPTVDEKRVERVRQDRQKTQKKVDELRQRCKEAEIYEETERESARKTRERSETQTKLKQLLDKHEDSFEAVFGNVPEGPWGDNVGSVVRRTERTMAQAETAATTAERAADRETQTVRQLAEEEQKTVQEATSLRNKIHDMCGCSPDEVNDRLAEVRSQLTAARKELAPLDSKAVLYESWSSEVKEKSCCPLCERRFNSKSGVNDLSSKLLNMSLSFPQETDRLKRIVLQCEEKAGDLANAAFYAEQLQKLENDDLRQLRQKKSIAELNLKDNREISEEKKQAFNKVKEQWRRIGLIQTDVSLMDTLLATVSRLDVELRSLAAQLPSSIDNVSYSELKEQLDQNESEVRRLVQENEELQLASNDKNKLTEQLHSLRERRIALGETAAQSTHLQEQISTKKEERAEQGRRLDELTSELPIAKRQVDRARASREDVDKTMKEKEEHLAGTIREALEQLKRLNDFAAKLSSLADNEKQAADCALSLRDVEEKLKQREMKKGRMEMQLNDMEGCQVKKRTLEDQLTRMIVEGKIGDLEGELADFQHDQEEANVLRRQLQKANTLREKAEIETSRIIGQMDEIEKKYRDASTALQRKEMVQAEKIYRDIIVDKLVIESTITDLFKYGECLDQSILQFHSDKMAAINEILDDLWRKVYKGGDIESIKIRADVASSVSDKRKSYDYRVVMMVEGGVEMDMRERCSAGQKMLACILIRIALADVFGGLCSIIALDEPTTNLDQHKIEHLAEMLNDLIAARRNDDLVGARQFQMVVITHDEGLVNKLTMGSRPDFFYVLGKDDRGLSFIRRKYPDGHLEGSDD